MPLPERKIIVEQLEHMKTHLNIRLCVSRRLEPEAELHPISAEFSQAMVVELPDNSSDIESYIETQLEKALSNHSLTLGDPMIVLEIRDALLRGSQGMFCGSPSKYSRSVSCKLITKFDEHLQTYPRISLKSIVGYCRTHKNQGHLSNPIYSNSS